MFEELVDADCRFCKYGELEIDETEMESIDDSVIDLLNGDEDTIEILWFDGGNEFKIVIDIFE